jgi:hypothetical protein
MAGTTYDKVTLLERLGIINSGFNYLYIKIDFSKTPVAAAGDNWKIARTKDGWLFKACYFRMPTDSTSTATIDVGTAEDGTELDTAIDVDAGSQEAWTAMTPTDASPVEVTADGYIWLDFNTAAISDGVIEFMFEIMAAPGEDSEVG